MTVTSAGPGTGPSTDGRRPGAEAAIPKPLEDVEKLGINVIRGLAMDGPRQANSGHPGTAMALAPLAHVLWTRVMSYDAADPDWPNRDRFVLSCGHASILLYSMLYLSGYDLALDDLKKFRQLGSRTPGHPESHELKGVEVTTGPLGQGVANGVGLGVAERVLRAHYGPELVDHYTFVICSDGDLMEGISHEAASLAGHLGLGRLIYVYDDNHITIDGPTEITLNDNAIERFAAYGWHTEDLGEVANDTGVLESAIRRAMAVEDKPSFLQLRSHIGWPSPKFTDNPKAHGDPFDPEEIKVTKEILGLPPDKAFWVPDEVIDFYRRAGARGRPERDAWAVRLEQKLPGGSPERARWDAQWRGQAMPGYEEKLPTWKAGDKLATRAAMKACLNAVVADVPGLVSGAADLTGNTGTMLDGEPTQSKEHPEGRLMAFGVREHGMGGSMVGMARHGGILPFGGTFFVFSDYMRGSVRLAALSQSKVVFQWSHDSVGLGEDGPTHQPVEQLAAMRAMPNLLVVRPADANEAAQALRAAIEHDGPTALILTRQTIPVLEGTAEKAHLLQKGAYVLEGDDPAPDIVLVGTGSEVAVCVGAREILSAEGVQARVVSLPSWELFEAQGEQYQREVLGDGVPVLAVEAAASFGWSRWADDSVSIDRFGASGPGAEVLAYFGFTPGNVADRARALLTLRSKDAHARKVSGAH
ncbi:MAG TPA: transketolase [Acidimicrobiales bacterium]|nr:transketolase [Acidimicrobiales bacterium]